MKPIRKPKYYAGRLISSGIGSLGGIKINENAEVVGLAVQALVELEEAARPIVEESLEGTNRRPRIAALRCLAAHPALWAVQPLFRVAGDEDVEVAGLAVQALVEMGEAPSPRLRSGI